VAKFKELEFPDPPSVSITKHAAQAAKDELRQPARALLAKFVLDATQGLVSRAAEALPFGSIAVSLLGEIANRIGTINENKDAAVKLGTVATRIAKRGEQLVLHFDKAQDQEGLELAQLLVQLTFLAMRLLGEIQEKKGILKKILVFVGCRQTREALERLTGELFPAVSFANENFSVTIHTNARERLEVPAFDSTVRASLRVPHTHTHTRLHCNTVALHHGAVTTGARAPGGARLGFYRESPPPAPHP